MVNQPNQGEYQTAVAWGMLSPDQQGIVKNELLDPEHKSLEGILGVQSMLEQNPQLVLGQLPADPVQRDAAVNAKKEEIKGQLKTYIKLTIAEPLAKAYGITNVDQIIDSVMGNLGAYLPLMAMLRGAMLIKAYETAPADVKGQVGGALVKNYATGLTARTQEMLRSARGAHRGEAG